MNQKKIAFTVCTANYLAHAKSMADSLIRHNPSYEFYICLLDEINGRFEENDFAPHNIITVKSMNFPEFDGMCSRYNLFELSCALKPFCALHLLQAKSSTQVFYFDTDILIFDQLEFLEQQLQQYSVLLTPHLTQPLPVDDKQPQEKNVLKSGNYNAGFFGVNNDKNGLEFLLWWRRTLVEHCYEKKDDCVFVDQKWLNFVPLFFKQVAILNHPGCNLAYWNMHERSLAVKENKFWVNEAFPLIFIHLSGFHPSEPSLLSRHQTRFDLKNFPAWQKICNIYASELKRNNVDLFSTLASVYKKKKFLGIFK